MLHLPQIIQDLAVILVLGAAVTVLFKKFKQPVVLGYLLAGFLVSPHISLTPTVVDTENIKVWGEIGVIFLLFGLGLEFSFKKLAEVGKTAAIAGLFEVLTMIGLGILAGQALGWSLTDSLFLGAALSISSTSIIVRAVDELGLKGRTFVSVVFGILVIEDLAAILILVLLPTLSSSHSSASSADLIAIALRLGFFLLLWFLVGIYLLPTVLKKAKQFLNDETLLILAIGLCLLMVLIASKTGFSAALGAFVMGSILAETREGKRIEHLLVPVRDLFSAVFFVSVGMMINPATLKEHFGVITILSVLLIVGKLTANTIGTLIAGQTLRRSVRTGMTLGQIGEFSFIIGTLGTTLELTSDFLYPILVAVSAVTSFTTPYLIRGSEAAAVRLETRLPQSILDLLLRYRTALNAETAPNNLSLLWREYGIKMLLNAVLVIAISVGASQLLLPPALRATNESLHHIVTGVLGFFAFAFSTPFLWAIVVAPPTRTENSNSSNLEMLRRLQVGIAFLRFLAGFVLTGFIIAQFASFETFSTIMLTLVALLILFSSRYAGPLYRTVEARFLSNLSANEKKELTKSQTRPALAPWDAVLVEFTLPPHSPLAGKTLAESTLKENTGTMVTMIERGGRCIFAPTRTTLLLPHDRIFLIGTDEQLAAAQKLIEAEVPPDESIATDHFGLDSLTLSANSHYVGRSIRECGLREDANGLVVGVERANTRTLNPISDFVLQAEDRVWIVGDRRKLAALRHSIN
ncbi:MAG: cation:proton antiporter [Bdellovibrionaceae bacterium]|nr:cation:proton antiporter [Pseudobdellovibrionaceae bacterium]